MVCGQTASKECYEQLPTWGFPLPYLWENGLLSTLHHHGMEDINIYKTLLHFGLNILFYLFAIKPLLKVVPKKKIFDNTQQ